MARRIAYNPYDGIEWATVGQYNFQSHAHTDYGSHLRHNGDAPPQEVVDFYASEAPVTMDIIALTDHQRAADTTVFPWTEWTELEHIPEDATYENRDPEELGVIAIEAMEVEGDDNEFDQMGGFNAGDLAVEYDGERDIFETIDERGGWGWFLHPGKYYDDPERDFGESYYREFLTEIEACIGFEVVNRNNRHPSDERFWDVALAALAPDQLVVGVAADDIHALRPDELTYPISWNVVLLAPAEFDPSDQPASRDAVQRAVTAGRTFFATVDDTSADARPPRISAVNVDEEAGEISITADRCDAIEWISDGEVVGTGAVVDLDSEEIGGYVRARLQHGDEGTLWTQAILLEEC